MKKILLFLLPTFLLSCIWVDGTTIDGNYKEQSGYSTAVIFEQIIQHASPQSKIEDILKERKTKSTLGHKLSENDLKEYDAVILMLKGKYETSIKALLALNEKNPKQYSIASNLGTAYELNGENEKALKWISEGIKRDSNSHYGTEWLHQLILKVKIAQKKNPNLLQTKRVINLPEKFSLESNISIDGQIHSISNIKRAIRYQLEERLVFVKPKEAIVADLLFCSAEIEAKTSTLEEALAYLKLAKLYGFSNQELLKEKEVFYQNIIDNPSPSYHVEAIQNPNTVGLFIVKFVLVIALLIIAILLKRVIFYVYRKIMRKEK